MQRSFFKKVRFFKKIHFEVCYKLKKVVSKTENHLKNHSSAVRAVASAAQFTERRRTAHGVHGRLVGLLPSRRRGSCGRARGAARVRAPTRRARGPPA